MNLLTGLAIYFILWWLVLFTVLPWGAHSHHETGEASEPGNAPSAPLKPRLAFKFVITTVVSAIVFAAVWALLKYELVTLDSIPLLPKFER